MPVLALIIHCIELMLKSITLKNGQNIKTFNHNLKSIKDEAIKILNQQFYMSQDSNNFIDLLVKLDEGGYAFRYPTDKNMKEFFINHNQNLARGISLSCVTIGFNSTVKDLEENYNKMQVN